MCFHPFHFFFFSPRDVHDFEKVASWRMLVTNVLVVNHSRIESVSDEGCVVQKDYDWADERK